MLGVCNNMGRTILPARYEVEAQLDELRRFVRSLRKEDRQYFEDLYADIKGHISSITYANPLPEEIENNMIYTMLLQEKLKKNVDIENLTLFIFSLMVLSKAEKFKTADPKENVLKLSNIIREK